MSQQYDDLARDLEELMAEIQLQDNKNVDSGAYSEIVNQAGDTPVTGPRGPWPTELPSKKETQKEKKPDLPSSLSRALPALLDFFVQQGGPDRNEAPPGIKAHLNPSIEPRFIPELRRFGDPEPLPDAPPGLGAITSGPRKPAPEGIPDALRPQGIGSRVRSQTPEDLMAQREMSPGRDAQAEKQRGFLAALGRQNQGLARSEEELVAVGSVDPGSGVAKPGSIAIGDIVSNLLSLGKAEAAQAVIKEEVKEKKAAMQPEAGVTPSLDQQIPSQMTDPGMMPQAQSPAMPQFEQPFIEPVVRPWSDVESDVPGRRAPAAPQFEQPFIERVVRPWSDVESDVPQTEEKGGLSRVLPYLLGALGVGAVATLIHNAQKGESGAKALGGALSIAGKAVQAHQRLKMVQEKISAEKQEDKSAYGRKMLDKVKDSIPAQEYLRRYPTGDIDGLAGILFPEAMNLQETDYALIAEGHADKVAASLPDYTVADVDAAAKHKFMRDVATRLESTFGNLDQELADGTTSNKAHAALVYVAQSFDAQGTAQFYYEIPRLAEEYRDARKRIADKSREIFERRDKAEAMRALSNFFQNDALARSIKELKGVGPDGKTPLYEYVRAAMVEDIIDGYMPGEEDGLRIGGVGGVGGNAPKYRQMKHVDDANNTME
jgi:hypothetical protein